MHLKYMTSGNCEEGANVHQKEVVNVLHIEMYPDGAQTCHNHHESFQVLPSIGLYLGLDDCPSSEPLNQGTRVVNPLEVEQEEQFDPNNTKSLHSRFALILHYQCSIMTRPPSTP